MPNLYAHYLAAARSLALIQDPALAGLIRRRRPAYNLGAQGPDIFYFHRAYPWTPHGRLGRLADQLHSQAIAGVYQAGVTYIRQAAPDERETLTAYLCGYAQHQALDANAHPYVIYKTGDCNLPGAAGHRHICAHSAFEVAIDTHLLEAETGEKPSWLIGQELMSVSPEAARAIAGLWQNVVGKVYRQSITGGQVLEAVTDTHNVSAFLLDTGPSPRSLLVQAVAMVDSSGRVDSARYLRRARHSRDCLNLAHQPWALPWDGAARQSASFLDLLGAAAGYGSRMAVTLAGALAGSEEPDAAQFDNRSFDTGLDCRLRPHLSCFDPAVR
jgi:hypothetical protein